MNPYGVILILCSADVVNALKQKAQYIQDHLAVLREQRDKMARCLHIDHNGDRFSAEIKEMTEGDKNDVEFRKRLINTFVSSVYIYNDKYIVCFNIPNYTEEDEQKIRLLSHSDECSDNLTYGRASIRAGVSASMNLSTILL